MFFRWRFPPLGGLAIGFCIVAGGWAIGTISGGALNPAVALGIDVAHATNGYTLGRGPPPQTSSFPKLEVRPRTG